MAAHGQSRGTEGLEWSSRLGWELIYGADGWMPFSASCKWDKAGNLPRIFSDYPVHFGIKGEAWCRLSEMAEIDRASTAKQLFVGKGQEVTDRWLHAESRIKAGSSRVQGHSSVARQQSRRPRHNNVPQLPPPPPTLCLHDWVWSSEYNLIYVSLHSASETRNEWMRFEAPREDKCEFPHVRRHPTSQLTDNKRRSIWAHNKERLCLLSAVKRRTRGTSNC